MVDWQELVIAIKRKSRKSLGEISIEVDVSLHILESMHSGRYASEPKFKTVFPLLCYAGEIGADTKRAVLI